ncbi:hypothetical protein DFH06DRAFT_769331 [Mycena polygramma]|nr:hypothetical protein DFH06DRAFT_769331 [Mycena polygramma]
MSKSPCPTQVPQGPLLHSPQNPVLCPLKREAQCVSAFCVVALPDPLAAHSHGQQCPHRTGQVRVERVQRNKPDSATAPIGIHPSNVVITDNDRRAILDRKDQRRRTMWASSGRVMAGLLVVHPKHPSCIMINIIHIVFTSGTEGYTS